MLTLKIPRSRYMFCKKQKKQLKTHQLFIQDKFNLHVFIRIRTRDLVQKLSKYLKFLTSAYT